MQFGKSVRISETVAHRTKKQQQTNTKHTHTYTKQNNLNQHLWVVEENMRNFWNSHSLWMNMEVLTVA